MGSRAGVVAAVTWLLYVLLLLAMIGWAAKERYRL